MYRLLFTTPGFLEYNLSIFLRRFTGMKSWLQKKWNNGKMLAELKPAFFLSLTFCFMIFIYAPLELYINNVDEFWYDVYLLFPFIIKDFFLFLLFPLVFQFSFCPQYTSFCFISQYSRSILTNFV